MPSDLVWVNSGRSFGAIAALRSAVPSSMSVAPAIVGDAASDDVLRRLAVVVERSVHGVSDTVDSLADEATLVVLSVIDADRRG